MKNLYTYIAIAVTAGCALLTTTSCTDFLAEKPLTRKTEDNFWNTRADAESVVNSLYFGGMPYMHNIEISGGWTPKATMWGGITSGLFIDTRKDRTFTTASEAGTYNVEAFDGIALSLWNELFIGIGRANYVLQNLSRTEEFLTPAEVKSYEAQAKFFRALNNFELVKNFGDIPKVTVAFDSPEEINQPRTPATEIYAMIEEDLLAAINSKALQNLTFYQNKGRVTQAMAETLLAQVYLQWAGYPVSDNSKYAKAAEMAQRVISSGVHSLEQAAGSKQGLESAYNVLKTSKDSKEVIYAKEYNWSSHKIGNSYPSRSIGTEAFQWKDAKGNGIFHPGGDVMYNCYLPTGILLDSYAPEDIRIQEKQLFFYEYTDDTGLEHTLGNAGNWMWFDEEALKKGQDSDYNMPMMRYAEVLLIAAEGYAKSGNEGKAREYLNQVRKRANLAPVTSGGDQLVQAILTERLHELPLEFRIWDDIRRTRLYPEADGMHSGTLKWTPLQQAKVQNKPAVGKTKVGGIPEYALLWPIPRVDMQANKELKTQNPGWK